ncbi:MAG: hypothetical protein EAX96_08290 [Candidatus Lokiarchaeota archaeon]|nr:hypothetical protein [Candidatus Lokiarchaeota archaeon]
MSEYDLSGANAPLEERIAKREIFFLQKKIGKPEAKVVIEKKIPKLFKGASGVEIEYLEVLDNYNPFIFIKGQYRVNYLKQEIISFPVPHHVVGAKVYDKVIEIGEPLTGEKQKKRALDINIVMKTKFETDEESIAFNPDGKTMNPKTIIEWKKENASSNFLDTNSEEVRRFAITTDQAIDQLRKKLLSKRPSDIKKINEEVFEISKNWVVLSPLFLYTLKYKEETKQVIIDAISQDFKVL